MTGTSSQQLAAFAAELRFDDIPADVVAHMKLCLLDTVGCGLYGSTLPWTQILRDTLSALDNDGSCPVWGAPVMLSSPHAALVNGTAVHAFELDDLHPRSIVHPGAVVIPPALAVATGRGTTSGRDLITAFVAGYEVAARVGSAVGAAHLLAGWHPTGTHGTLGAAAAAGSVLGLTAQQMSHALGIAGSQSSGLMAAQYGAMVKRLHAGHAAQSGVYAALLAARGFTGIADLFDSPYGGYLGTFSPRFDPTLITAGLGSTWEVSQVGFKPYSTNGSCHPAIDALLDLRELEGVRADNVDSVCIRCSTATLEHVGWDYEPDSVTTAQMNLPYIVSVVITDGDAFVDQFTTDRINDPALVEMSKRVHVSADPEIDARGDRFRHATHVEVRLRDGRVLRQSCDHAKGSASSPLSEQDLVSKFFKLATKAVDQDQARALRDLVNRLDELDDIAELTRHLSPEVTRNVGDAATSPQMLS